MRNQRILRQDTGDRRCGFVFDFMCYMCVDLCRVFVMASVMYVPSILS